MKKQPPTLEDVAAAAAVSTATISRAINEPGKVAPVTLERIQKIIDELGYTPNFGGRALASSRSNTVGAIIPTMANAMFASGLQAFQEVLSEAGVNLLVASSGYSDKNELQQIRSLMAHGADGLLLIGSTRSQETEQFLKLRNIPYVISWCYQNDTSRLFAGFNNKQAAYRMTMTVLDAGHRHIAMIGGQATGNDRAANRIIGVKQAIEKYASNACLAQLIETSYSMDNGGDAFEQIMTATQPPTVVICGNDVLAAGAVVRAQLLGISIPEQVSITGFDDINLALAVNPSLTTVRVPQLEMGKTAATLLLDLLSGKPVASVEFETEIVWRGSLASP